MKIEDILRPAAKGERIIDVLCLDPGSLAGAIKKLPGEQQNYLSRMGFKAEAGECLCLPFQGGIDKVFFGLGEKGAIKRTPFLPGKLADLLPEGAYRLVKPDNPRLATLAFALASYRFRRYKKSDSKRKRASLICDKSELEQLRLIAEAIFMARDLINTPANDLGPNELTDAIRGVAKAFGAKCTVISGQTLERGFPLIHAVGKGSARAPRLVDLNWGKASHPKVTLVGKGVVFDSGGLDLKSSSNMLLMKKDMGGAACALALARMIMAARLKVRLRLLIPIVENAVSGLSFRPGDIVKSRKGLSVEINNTDAEGRLILADALTLADEEKPDLLIDLATLTGAARIALGPDLPPFYTRDEKLAQRLETYCEREYDPLWRMPLWKPYLPSLKSKIADVSNISGNAFAGSVLAALFLSKFVSCNSWLHLDIFAWNPSTSPGRPEGGEVQAARALFALLKDKYGRARR